MIGKRQGVIPRGRRNAAAQCALFLALELQYGVPRTPFLETARELLKFVLEKDFGPDELGDKVRLFARRALDAAANGHFRTRNVSKRDG